MTILIPAIGKAIQAEKLRSLFPTLAAWRRAYIHHQDPQPCERAGPLWYLSDHCLESPAVRHYLEVEGLIAQTAWLPGDLVIDTDLP